MSVFAKPFGCAIVAALSFAGVASPARSQDKKPATPNPMNLDKQIDDAIKALDKLDPKETDEAKKQLQINRRPIPIGGFGINGIAGVGGVGGLEGANIEQILEALNGNLAGNLGGNLGGLNGGMVGRGLNTPNARFGATLQPVEKTLEAQLRLQPNQGQVVMNVLPNSAAAKAGIKQHDILLEIEGKAVSSDRNAFNKQLADLKADAEVEAIVLREGKKETVKGIKLPQVNVANPRLPGNFQAPGLQIFPGGLPGGFPGFNGGAGGIQFPQFPGGGLIELPPIQIPGGAGAFQVPQGAAAVRIQAFNLGDNESTSVSVTDEGFVIQHAAGGLKIAIKGTREDGKANPSEINIEDGDTKVRAQALPQVPAMYLPTVNRLLESVK